MDKPKTPDSILPQKNAFKRRSWDLYNFTELGSWVHLLVKRSDNRTGLEKRQKDLVDAQNYLNMMQSKLDAFKEDAGMGEPEIKKH